MTDTKNPNKPLFSQHYLEYRLQECLEWQLDINSDFEKLNKLYLSKKAILPTLNEAQTEDVFIKPVLDILGFKNIPQVVTRSKGRSQRPDYALFANENERDIAYSFQDNESTGVDWGILTNGREWRLYYRQASSTATEFYPIDLVELLESEEKSSR